MTHNTNIHLHTCFKPVTERHSLLGKSAARLDADLEKQLGVLDRRRGTGQLRCPGSQRLHHPPQLLQRGVLRPVGPQGFNLGLQHWREVEVVRESLTGPQVNLTNAVRLQTSDQEVREDEAGAG